VTSSTLQQQPEPSKTGQADPIAGATPDLSGGALRAKLHAVVPTPSARRPFSTESGRWSPRAGAVPSIARPLGLCGSD
jgi:hypothetical protein